MLDKKAFLDQEEVRLAQAEARLGHIRARAENLPSRAGEKLIRRLDELEARLRVLSDQLTDLREDSSGSWKVLRRSFGRSSIRLNRDVARLEERVDA